MNEHRPSDLVADLRRDQLNTVKNKLERLAAANEIERLQKALIAARGEIPPEDKEFWDRVRKRALDL